MKKNPKVLVAPNAFKGSLSASAAARAMADGVRRVFPRARVREVPLADGGDGTLELLSQALGARLRRTRVTGPLGRPLVAAWAYHRPSRTAVIEMARASGLALVPPSRRRPEHTTSYGTGELLRAALTAGAQRIFLTVGGSATVDGGLGILQALGVTVWLRQGDTVFRAKAPLVGGDLCRLSFLDTTTLDARWRRVRLNVLCDVNNVLLGPRGAARVFGPQKGASPAGVKRLEKGLKGFALWVKGSTGRDVRSLVGAGAAGGVPGFLWALVDARVGPGTETIFKVTGVERWVRWADVVLTGEGRLDVTSLEGKALRGVAGLCRRYKKPLWVYAGDGIRRVRGIAKIHFISRGVPLRRAMKNAPALLQGSVEKTWGRFR